MRTYYFSLIISQIIIFIGYHITTLTCYNCLLHGAHYFSLLSIANNKKRLTKVCPILCSFSLLTRSLSTCEHLLWAINLLFNDAAVSAITDHIVVIIVIRIKRVCLCKSKRLSIYRFWPHTILTDDYHFYQ